MRISDWSSDVCSSDLSDFKLLHPGGALGKRLLRVADLMHGAEALPLCGPDTVMSEAILIMTAVHFGCVGIVDDSRRLIGILTDEIGRASCRERVCQYVYISVCAVSLQKKNHTI